MGMQYSREAPCFTFIDREVLSRGSTVVIAGCLALALITEPSLAWAGEKSMGQQGSTHRLIDHKKFNDLKVRMAELKNKLQQDHRPNDSGSRTGTLEGLRAKVTALEGNLAALLSADSTLLTSVQAAHEHIAILQARIATLESRPSAGGGGIPDLEKYVFINPDPINGVNGPHIIFRGVNVHVQSGSGATVDTTTGLGNLIIGYNETDPSVGIPRNGSHNLVGGQMNSFSSSGGLVFGVRNAIRGQYAAILGGERNMASGVTSSILGGAQNTASGQYSTVLGGQFNIAPSPYAIRPELQAGGG